MSTNKIISEIFSELNLSDGNKVKLQGYYSRLVRNKHYFKLSRNRVMVKDEKSTKFIVLDFKAIKEDNIYLCRKCMNVDGLQYMSVFDPSQLEPCLHSQVCKLLWGNSLVYLEEKYDTHLIEVISQEPIYLVAVHLEDGAKKDTGVVGMTTKTLKPKCFTCSGRDACIHLTLHLNKYEDNV